MCLNRKVLAGLAVAAAGVFLVAPGVFRSALPLLLLAACPLSMVFMMRGMSRGGAGAREDTSGEKPGVSAESEIARLRAEVDQLKAAQADRVRAVGGVDAADGRAPHSDVSGP